MNEKEWKELVSKISSKIHDDVKKELRQTAFLIGMENAMNDTRANGHKFGSDEMSDFIGDLMNDVAVDLTKRLVD